MMDKDTISWIQYDGQGYNIMNCFTCTVDGDSAFEVVNRPIQKREIFAEGEAGALW